MPHRHLRAGWWGLTVFIALGIVLEFLHAVKASTFLDVGRETTRLMLRLAHAHGTLVSLVNVVYALTLRARPDAEHRLASASLLVALVLLPGGFLLGGLWAHGGDPGIGALLIPIGAFALLLGGGLTARQL